MIIGLPGDYEVTMLPFLSGAEVLNQTFVDLFADETIVDGEGLAVRLLALLFTDLKASTELYERIGDLKAFDLVRLHFGYLREIAAQLGRAREDDRRCGDGELRRSARRPAGGARHAGADRPLERRGRRRADRLKVGLHAGACLAVTLNDRLDYFGQTVNIAARVQALAGADEIVVTDDVLSLPGAAELVAGLEIEEAAVELRDRRRRRSASLSRGRLLVEPRGGWRAAATPSPSASALAGHHEHRAHQRPGREPRHRTAASGSAVRAGSRTVFRLAEADGPPASRRISTPRLMSNR